MEKTNQAICSFFIIFLIIRIVQIAIFGSSAYKELINYISSFNYNELNTIIKYVLSYSIILFLIIISFFSHIIQNVMFSFFNLIFIAISKIFKKLHVIIWLIVIGIITFLFVIIDITRLGMYFL